MLYHGRESLNFYYFEKSSLSRNQHSVSAAKTSIFITLKYFACVEPNVYSGGLVPLDPDQIARDFVSLRALAKQYAWFSMETRIVGPDVVGTDPASPSGKILKRY